MIASRVALSCILGVIAAAPLAAHDPGMSSSRVTVESGFVTAVLTFDRADLARAVDLDRRVDLQLAGMTSMRSASTELRLVRTVVEADDGEDVRVVLVFDAAGASTLEWQLPILESLPRGHRHYAAVTDHAGRIVAEALLSRSSNVLRSDAVGTGAATEFLVLGIEHILSGYDHILFLLALLLVARSFRDVALTITAFTVAHSLTLGAATLGLVTLPGELVEPVIALSIVWIGVRNLITATPKHGWLTTFVFGLMHGFGFASVLAELGCDGVLSLAAFNSGVEVGQIAIAAVLLPVLAWLRTRPGFGHRVVPIASLLVTLCGGWWLLERTLLA